MGRWIVAELSLPERVVHAAEAAIQGEARYVRTSPLGDRVDGYAVDMARMAGAAVVDVLAEDLKGQLCCNAYPDPQCMKCGQLYAEIDNLRFLAQLVRDVPAEVT